MPKHHREIHDLLREISETALHIKRQRRTSHLDFIRQAVVRRRLRTARGIIREVFEMTQAVDAHESTPNAGAY